ncbi:unnamed protein product [Linum trigynum]|uniref:Uncharacterized protein n=1 Tax=Linum trigynum TaxID=586398 RepID=A0AAV2G0E1_9ROSI
MTTEDTTDTIPDPTQHEERMAGMSGWADGTRKRFSEILQQDNWYIEELDSEDVAQAEKEEDEDTDEMENDHLCQTALFTAAEKIRWRREWRSALVVQGLGRRVSFLPLSRRLNFLWGRHGDL